MHVPEGGGGDEGEVGFFEADGEEEGLGVGGEGAEMSKALGEDFFIGVVGEGLVGIIDNGISGRFVSCSGVGVGDGPGGGVIDGAAIGG